MISVTEFGGPAISVAEFGGPAISVTEYGGRPVISVMDFYGPDQ